MDAEHVTMMLDVVVIEVHVVDVVDVVDEAVSNALAHPHPMYEV